MCLLRASRTRKIKPKNSSSKTHLVVARNRFFDGEAVFVIESDSIHSASQTILHTLHASVHVKCTVSGIKKDKERTQAEEIRLATDLFYSRFCVVVIDLYMPTCTGAKQAYRVHMNAQRGANA